MYKNLVIVESPAKAKTIEKFLGKDFKVMSSYGHIRDLKKKVFSIDISNNFTPIYEIPTDKKKLVDELKEAANQSEMVWLASDEDREGEAISWHLFEALNLTKEKTQRIVFHEITKNAILHAIDHPREIDFNLVNAQQARRILDRIVGFEMSPILWKRVKPALSAGRVQSVAVRLIVDREREVNDFVAEKSYRVVALFTIVDADGKKSDLKSELQKRFTTKDEALSFLNYCASTRFHVKDVSKKPFKKSPAAPFTTSTLQQEAARKLGFSVSQTMRVAQKLYEDGLITYMRTDSVNLSTFAISAAKDEIARTMGSEYIQTRQYSSKSKGAQEAHEAIRPTYMDRPTIEGSSAEKRLYDLIWKRTLASQMTDAALERTTVTIEMDGRSDYFTAIGEVILFDGFLKVYLESNDDDRESDKEGTLIPPISIGESLDLKEMNATERYTQRPARYNEAMLVKKLEELGIGRPSTYAPTISTIQQREYVLKEDKKGEERTINTLLLKKGKITDTDKIETFGADKAKLIPTDIGTIVSDFLVDNFPSILDYHFTANVEKEFDMVADGEKVWQKSIEDFYTKFHPLIESASEFKSEKKVGERLLGNDPKSGKEVSVKIGRFGPVIQLGETSSKEKPLFASLLKGESMDQMTLEEALKHFELPRIIGEYNGAELTAAIGRFGPYVKYGKEFVSIPKELSPLEISLDQSIVLIELKKANDAKKQIKLFDEDPEVEILNGRFGPYIAYKGKNYKIPKGSVPGELSLSDCQKIISTKK